MSYSGIIKDHDAGSIPRASFSARFIVFTLASLGMGWAFTTYMPQLDDLAWRFGLGFAMAIVLILLTVNVADTRGQRMFAALFFSAGFIAGMWGLWIKTEFGAIPTLDQLQARFANTSYTMSSFGEPFEVRGYIFEMWVGITALLAAMPLFASLAKPQPAGTRHNPFDVHPDFAQPFGSKLFLLPIVGFLIAAIAVYVDPYVVEYGLPLQLVWIPPLVAGFIYAKLHMTFIKALIVSIVGGIGAAAGFWLPWLYMTYGQDGMIAFLQGTPQEILVRVQETAAGYSYRTETAGHVSDFSPWAYEIWIGLTLTYLALPVLITLCRRFLYFVRAS